MENDLRQTLSLAFRHLDGFSLPGIGTFHRSRQGAVVDHQRKKLMAPAEKFILVEGESLVSVLEDFCFRHYRITLPKAQEMVAALAQAVQQELSAGRRVEIPGLGSICRERDRGTWFEPAAGPLSQEGDFFGLGELEYTYSPTRESSTPEQQKEAVRQAVMQAGMERNPAANVEAPRPARRAVWPWILLLVLAGAGFAGWYWRADIAAAFAGGKGGTHPVTPPVPADSGMAQNPPPADTHTTASLPPDTAPARTDAVTDAGQSGSTSVAAEHTAPAEVETVPARRGQHYLIVGAAHGAEGILELKASLKKAGLKPVVLTPQGRRGMYRVSAFQSANREEVIRKMVEWKQKYPASWILSL